MVRLIQHRGCTRASVVCVRVCVCLLRELRPAMGRRQIHQLSLRQLVRRVSSRCCGALPVAVLLLVTVTATCDGHVIPAAATATATTVERRPNAGTLLGRREVASPTKTPPTTGMQSEMEVEQLRRTILEGLGLTRMPDVAKMNVSQEEYSRMYKVYLQSVEQNARRHESHTQAKLQRFYSFTHVQGAEQAKTRVRRSITDTTWLYFPVDIPESRQQYVTIESATLRLFVSSRQPLLHARTETSPTTVHVRIYQVLQPSPENPTEEERLLVDQKDIHLHSSESKWTDLDVTRAAQAWNIGGNGSNFGLELVCHDCARKGVVLVTQQTSGSNSSVSPVLNLLAGVHLGTREKRATDPLNSQERQKEVCHKDGKKCCRHVMKVNFKEIQGFEFILQPKEFDAGYCKGGCPARYNPAHHHALLQSLIRKQNHSEPRIPRVCCAPSRLRGLEVLHLAMDDPTKLKMTLWDNMEVLECACS